ncbi:MAG: DNA recombination/repair protein RecA, partial [Planctomycetes bacterium]|nr:DNA recombination/repair protein RecA [Planctomycetota bacterium]
IGQLKDGDLVVGNRTRVTVVKNKIAPPFRKVEFDILFNKGISREGELLDLGQRSGTVQRSGTWYSMKHPTDGEIRLGQGMERSRNFLIDNPDLADVIETEIRAFFAVKEDPMPDEEPDMEIPAAEAKPEAKPAAATKEPAKAPAGAPAKAEAPVAKAAKKPTAKA